MKKIRKPMCVPDSPGMIIPANMAKNIMVSASYGGAATVGDPKVVVGMAIRLCRHEWELCEDCRTERCIVCGKVRPINPEE